MSSNWFLTLPVRPDPRVRLFCFPYAGAGAAAFREWGRELPEWVEVRAVQLPGRGWRLREAPLTDLGRIAAEAAEEIGRLADLPYAIFGHSMGAWLGYEVARRLEAVGTGPAHLLVSGRQAPSLGITHPPMSHLDDAAFVAEIQRRYGGIPAEVLASPELLALLLPALRADVAALEAYEYGVGTPLACPVTVFGGESDPLVPVDDLAPWATTTAGPVEVETFPGGHFYFQERLPAVLSALRLRLGRLLATAGVDR